ncbi:MAG: hypothetical protein LLG01_00500 [Planctomycetaceae bacterium]|nr:hypothetical protein [Planctomycetaceae bacterium]
MIIASIGVTVVGCAEAMSELVDAAREGGRYPALKWPVDPEAWVKLYRGHRRLQRVVLDQFLGGREVIEGGEAEATVSDVVELMQVGLRRSGRITGAEVHEVTRILKEHPKEVMEGAEAAREAWEGLMSDDDKIGPEDDKEMKEALRQPEVLFFLLVWGPCFFEYGQYPPRLMRKARQGDPDALEKILRLDKRAIHDPKIAREWSTASMNRNAYFDRLAGALAGEPVKLLGLSQVKVLMAALLSNLSKLLADGVERACESMGQPVPPALIPLAKRLSGRDIRELFDAYQKDVKRNSLACDNDLPGDNEALKKALQRNRPLWDFLFESAGLS